VRKAEPKPVKSSPVVVPRRPAAPVSPPAPVKVHKGTPPAATEFEPRRTSREAPEFARARTQARTAAVDETRSSSTAQSTSTTSGGGATAPEFAATQSAPEFGP
jgi:hypothetical protein